MRRVLIVVAAVALLAAVAPAGGTAESFDCGDVIKESIKLNNSLLNCRQDGLVVGADGITIDLGNETIAGKGDGAGILNEKGFSDVVVRNGAITGFEHGILIDSPKTTSNVFDDLELSANDVAVSIEGGANDNVVTDSELFANDEGILIEGSENVVTDNEIFDETPAIAIAGDENVVADNEIDYSIAGPGDSDPSIAVEGDDNIVEDNEVLAGETGIAVSGRKNVIEGNELEGGLGDGIVFEGDSNEVRSNEIEGYDDYGIRLRDGAGNLLFENDVSEGSDEGILVQADETRIEGNKSDDNGNDGIQVNADDVRIVRNSADDNGFDDGKGYGILADGEGVEGTDNDARGNANPKECAPAALCR